jgi:hypothetical protein
LLVDATGAALLVDSLAGFEGATAAFEGFEAGGAEPLAFLTGGASSSEDEPSSAEELCVHMSFWQRYPRRR